MSNISIPKTMKVPIFKGDSKIEWGEKEVLAPGKGELLIQVKANAICGTDRTQFFQGSDVTPGHEASGIVVAVGIETKFEVGTPGVIFLMDYCGECRSCKLGLTNQCLHKRADIGFTKDGGYGSYILINENIFFPIDSDIPLTEATMLLDVMGTSGHAIKRAKLVHQDIQSVLVAGAGPIGLGVAALSKLILGKDIPVFIMDYVSFRLEIAQKLGAIPINLKEQSLEEVLETNNYHKIDMAVDTTGKTIARQTSLNALNQRGVLVCVGHGEGLNLEISKDLIAPERAVLGSEYFQYSELNENLKILKENLPYLRNIITHRFNIEDIQQAFEVFLKGETGKVVIEQ